ncbi:hypothetical protein KVR01_000514 [Diaporthe batatas]|uniref:uncharacterized protein n=1 Tax=Diaporthe batatas TaxID=748121 RepID=UPI001D037989|nr:uncharacterized protein KVR01_000514 [Diaporthe batatas]KAG8169769.1 hypothetical protein KVR01_000514 [Diaporthe batatas]
MFSLVQLFTFGLAALTARNGFQVSTTSNVGVSRVAGSALMAFAIPALAMPLENTQLVARNGTEAAGGEDCNDDSEDDQEDDKDDDEADSEDDKEDQEDDKDDDEADSEDDKDDQEDDEGDEEHDSEDNEKP